MQSRRKRPFHENMDYYWDKPLPFLPHMKCSSSALSPAAEIQAQIERMDQALIALVQIETVPVTAPRVKATCPRHPARQNALKQTPAFTPAVTSDDVGGICGLDMEECPA
jgi:hypothetical protein